MAEAFIPITLFGAIVGIVWLVSFFNQRKRQVAHETLRHAIDNGQQISSDLIEKMTMATDPVRADLRRGVLFLAVGLAFMFFGWMVGSEEEDAIKPLIGLASFPILVGLAYIGLFAFARPKAT